MKIGVVGSRSFTDSYKIQEILAFFKPTEIVSGGALGADTLAKRYAELQGIRYKEFPAEWNRYGKRAGYLRNKEIVEYSDMIIAFWNGESPGTKLTINLAMDSKKSIFRFS